MITEELVNYIKNQRQAGVSDQAIREALLSVGWSQQDADQALITFSDSSPQEEPVSFSPELNQTASHQEQPQSQNSQGFSSSFLQEEVVSQASQTENLLEPKESIQASQESYSSPVSQQENQPEGFVSENQSSKPAQELITSLEESEVNPIELDDQGQPINKISDSPSLSERLEEPVKTETGLSEPVSLSSPGLENPTATPKEVGLQPETSSEETTMEISDKPPQQEEAPFEVASTSSSDQPPQVAIDPKVD